MQSGEVELLGKLLKLAFSVSLLFKNLKLNSLMFIVMKLRFQLMIQAFSLKQSRGALDHLYRDFAGVKSLIEKSDIERKRL